jgi:hypothetical protein
MRHFILLASFTLFFLFSLTLAFSFDTKRIKSLKEAAEAQVREEIFKLEKRAIDTFLSIAATGKIKVDFPIIPDNLLSSRSEFEKFIFSSMQALSSIDLSVNSGLRPLNDEFLGSLNKRKIILNTKN